MTALTATVTDRSSVRCLVRCPQRLQRQRSPLPPRRRRARRWYYSRQHLPEGCSGRRPQVQLAQARCRPAARTAMPTTRSATPAPAAAAMPCTAQALPKCTASASASRTRPSEARRDAAPPAAPAAAAQAPAAAAGAAGAGPGGASDGGLGWGGGKGVGGLSGDRLPAQGARARPTCARECRRSNYEVTVFGLFPGRV